jgi:hypothetical protein
MKRKRYEYKNGPPFPVKIFWIGDRRGSRIFLGGPPQFKNPPSGADPGIAFRGLKTI